MIEPDSSAIEIIRYLYRNIQIKKENLEIFVHRYALDNCQYKIGTIAHVPETVQSHLLGLKCVIRNITGFLEITTLGNIAVFARVEAVVIEHDLHINKKAIWYVQVSEPESSANLTKEKQNDTN